jgi:hypothetical protein
MNKQAASLEALVLACELLGYLLCEYLPAECNARAALLVRVVCQDGLPQQLFAMISVKHSISRQPARVSSSSSSDGAHTMRVAAAPCHVLLLNLLSGAMYVLMTAAAAAT